MRMKNRSYQFLPLLTNEEFRALKADIAERGVQVPVEFDEEGNVLDGYHRLKACQELGISSFPCVVRPGLSEDQKITHILALNLARRHLTVEQRRNLVAKLRQMGWSTTRIGEKLGIADITVRRDLSSGSTNVEPEYIVGKDGKTYPARRQPVKIKEPGRLEEQVPKSSSGTPSEPKAITKTVGVKVGLDVRGLYQWSKEKGYEGSIGEFVNELVVQFFKEKGITIEVFESPSINEVAYMVKASPYRTQNA